MMKTLRSAKKGSAGGPSGMTVEHLRPLLESGVCTALLGEVATQLTQGVKFQKKSFACSQMTAQKPGGVRGIVVGDVFRRLVGRTLSQAIPLSKVRRQHIPSNFALFPPVQARNVLHTLCRRLPVSIQVPPSCPSVALGPTILSRRAMFRGLMDMVDGEKLVPFVMLFYDSPSTYIWEDEVGDVRHVLPRRRW